MFSEWVHACSERPRQSWDGAGADQPVLGLEEDFEPFGHVVRDQRRDADAEIDEIARSKLLRHAAGDDGLCIHGSPIRNEIIDQRPWCDDMVGCDHANRNDVFRGNDDSIGCHRHHGIEIARCQGLGEIAEVICQKCVNQREIGAERSLQQELLAVNLDLLLAFLDEGADAGRRQYAGRRRGCAPRKCPAGSGRQ
jgi:hypothetical protein